MHLDMLLVMPPYRRALLRCSILVALAVASMVPAAVVILDKREAGSKAAMCRIVERSAAERLGVATDPDERRLLRERIAEHARLRARYERASRWPW